MKESDRLLAVSDMLSRLGADIMQTEDGLVIQGKKRLSGGSVCAHNDHRIAMSAAVASTVCNAPVLLSGAEAVSKSYPAFWEDLRRLGATLETL